MSRGSSVKRWTQEMSMPPLPQATDPLSHYVHPSAGLNMGKQIKAGYLLRYKRNWVWKSWREEWVVLYEDSTLAWYKDKGTQFPRGYLRLNEAPELVAISEWTVRVPCRPQLPADCKNTQLIAVGSKRRKAKVYWLLAQSQDEVTDWMTAIRNTLPPPPKLIIETDNQLPHSRHTTPTKDQKNLIHPASPKNVIVSSNPDDIIIYQEPNQNEVENNNRVAEVAAADIPPPLPAPRIRIDNSTPSPPVVRKSENQDDYASGLIMGGAQFNWGQGLGWTKLYTGMSTLDTIPAVPTAHHFGSISGPSSAAHDFGQSHFSTNQHHHHHTSAHHVDDYTGYEDIAGMDCAFDFSF